MLLFTLDYRQTVIGNKKSINLSPGKKVLMTLSMCIKNLLIFSFCFSSIFLWPEATKNKLWLAASTWFNLPPPLTPPPGVTHSKFKAGWWGHPPRSAPDPGTLTARSRPLAKIRSSPELPFYRLIYEALRDAWIVAGPFLLYYYYYSREGSNVIQPSRRAISSDRVRRRTHSFFLLSLAFF